MNASPFLDPHRPALLLAPMEGVTDAPMRDLMTAKGGITHCVSEFLRVAREVPINRVIKKHVPEIEKSDCRTASGIPIHVQILGGNPERMALAAQRISNLGAQVVDLNFGCPAPTVNRHDGGATILKDPMRVRKIVEAVRGALPEDKVVSAKVRLGWDDPGKVYEICDRAAEGGASWITIHGRTKTQGYRPPADWTSIGEVRKRLGPLPVVANGDIKSLDSFKRCQDLTGCIHFMVGRGLLVDPLLGKEIGRTLGLFPGKSEKFSWHEIISDFVHISGKFSGHGPYIIQRIKQWLKMAHLGGAISWFDAIKRETELASMLQKIKVVEVKNT